MRSSCIALLTLGLVGLTSTARAQDDEARFRQGVDMRAAGQDAQALAHFRQMHDEFGTPRTLAQIAFAEQALGRWGAAALHLEQARLRPDDWVRTRSTVVEQSWAEIGTHVGRVEVAVEGEPTDVELDGLVVGRSPLPGSVPATAGTVALRLLRGGAVVAERTLTVRVGQLTRETVVAPGAQSSSSGGGGGGGGAILGPLGWVSIAVGGAAAVGMAIAWGMRESFAQTYNDDARCAVPGMPRSATCMSEYDSAQSAELAAIVLGVGGGVFVALGLALVIAGVGTSSERAQLTCAPGLLGLSCGGQF